jgi:hypothetical protein
MRRAALRKAWSLDPVISTYIGPADYAWDFNAPDGVPGFALELGGDVRKLLAQAIGLDREDEEAGGDDPESAVTPEGSEVEAPAAAPEPALLAQATPAEDGVIEAPAATAEIGAPAEEREILLAPEARPRRHGSALPG